MFIYCANTYLFRRDDESLLQQPLPDQEQLLVELSNPEAVAVDAGELEELQYDAVEERVADGQGQLDVANVPCNWEHILSSRIVYTHYGL